MNEGNVRVAKGLIWKLLERFGVLGIQFLLQVVLARILNPEHYGVLSLMLVFTALANVFIQNGLNTALVQNRDVTEDDYSSVFWVTLCVAIVLYALLFVCAPMIGAFYEMPDLVMPFRVLCLILFPGALNSVQLAIVSRRLDFKRVFRSNVLAILISGIVGIILALMGAGLWALVVQNLANVTFACVVMWFTIKWRPKFLVDIDRVKVLFSYGWKLLMSSLLDTFYQDIQSLVIGKKYNADTLGYYNRGKQFPQFIINSINSAVQSVLLPAMSAEQDDICRVKAMTKNSVIVSSYVIFPMMAGLAGASAPLVQLLLTDKWLPCVPFLQICCLTFAFYPVYTSNLQAIKAVGRSDIFLKLEVIKKIVGICILFVAIFCFDSPLAIALSGAVSIPVDILINAYPNKKLIGYSYSEQIEDIFPSFFLAILVYLCVIAVKWLSLSAFLTLIVQIVVGVLVYVAVSAVLRLKPYRILCSTFKDITKKTK